MYIFDSFAWIEFFDGSVRGQAVKKFLDENKESIATTTANYYEVFYRIEQKLGPIIRERHMKFVENNSRLILIDINIAEKAAQLRLSENLSAIDAFTLAAARLNHAKVVTGDNDFKKFKDVIMI